jgi:hypothetical protein
MAEANNEIKYEEYHLLGYNTRQSDKNSLD